MKTILKQRRTNKDVEGERTLYMNLFVVSLRDLISRASNKYTKECKDRAYTWLDSTDETYFSFNTVVEHLFGDIDEEMLRVKLKKMLKDKKVKGTRNLIKILTEIDHEQKEEDNVK